MADEESKRRSKGSGAVAVAGSNPEKDSTGVLTGLKRMSKEAILCGFQEIVNSIVDNIKTNKSLPPVKMLVDLAQIVDAGEEFGPENYRGFADEMWAMLKTIHGDEAEPGPELEPGMAGSGAALPVER
jgi:hypothetical protein